MWLNALAGSVKNTQRLTGIKKLLVLQLCIFILISFSLWPFAGWKAGYSAFLGGLTAFIPSLLFARKLFQYKGAQSARQILKSFYVGEFQKIAVSMAMFAAVFLLVSVNPPAFFLTYMSGVMICWIAPLVINNKHDRVNSD